MKNTVIVNLTSFSITPELKDAGVRQVNPAHFAVLKELLEFNEIPTSESIIERSRAIAKICAQATDFYILSLNPFTKEIKAAQENLSTQAQDSVRRSLGCAAMVSCAPWMLQTLVLELEKYGIKAIFSFTKKEYTEGESKPKYKHVDFVAA